VILPELKERLIVPEGYTTHFWFNPTPV